MRTVLIGRRRAWLAIALGALVVTGGVRVASAARAYSNAALKVRTFAPPLGWDQAPQSTYPRLLAAYKNKDGARLTLAAQRVGADASATSLVEQSRPALVRQGLRGIVVTPLAEPARGLGAADPNAADEAAPPSSSAATSNAPASPTAASPNAAARANAAKPPTVAARLALEATLGDGRFVRQLYLVHDGIGYVLTIIGARTRANALRHDFDEAVQSLAVGDADDEDEIAPR